MSAQHTPGQAALPPQATNYIATSSGRVSAVCCCCGQRSRPVAPDDQGEPDMWRMGRGWSTAPYPSDCKHDDGSVGSTFHCPTCNRKLRSGETLQRRAYLADPLDAAIETNGGRFTL